jgi:hypothetical protein
LVESIDQIMPQVCILRRNKPKSQHYVWKPTTLFQDTKPQHQLHMDMVQTFKNFTCAKTMVLS